MRMNVSEEQFEVIVNSPGRINLIGEHTDYNNGFVLPTAIHKQIKFKLRKNNSATTCNVHSTTFNTSFSFNLNQVEPSKTQWENYILGVIFELQQLTNKLKGFDCILESTIPVGSGISSSAALECGLAFGLNKLFNLKLSKLTLVEIGQKAEHNFVGTKCGIMDQFASVMSKKNHVLLLDCKSMDYSYVPLQINPYKILLLNTNVSHNLASSEYNVRRKQCEEGVQVIQKKYPEVRSLRDVTLPMLENIKNDLNTIIFNRCLYVVQENIRVLDTVEALKNNQLVKVGQNMYKTHQGLSELYQVSCPELDFLVNFSKDFHQVIGARVMGGGFGGCTINLVHENFLNQYLKEASEAYFNKFNIKLTAFEAIPSSGTRIVNN